MRYSLRPYQSRAIELLRESYRQGHKRVVLVSPTGSGKTVIAMAIVELAAVKNGGRVLFIAHRREIIDQTSKKLDEIGVHHGVIMGDDGRHDLSAPVQVASIQTLIRRELPPADFIIIDECHLSVANSYIKVLDAYNDTPVLGLTATPWRTDGRGLGSVYQDMVVVSQVKGLIQRGFLIAPEIYAPYRPDLSNVKVRAGDYVEADLSRALDKNHLVGSIVHHWKAYARDKITVAFACSIQHSKHIVENFLKAGVPAAHIDHETPRDERNAVLEKLASGEIKVVSNVGILTEGWDLPALEVAIMARPTMSESLYLQMVGRIMRPTKGKTRAMMLDHAGCFFDHNSPIVDRCYSLEDRKQSRKKKGKNTNKIKTCPDCYRVCAVNALTCKGCGYQFEDKRVLRETNEGLYKIRHDFVPSCKECGEQALRRARIGYISPVAIEYRCNACGTPTTLGTKKARELTQAERHAEYYKLRAYAAVREYKSAWAFYRYQDLFGVTPQQDGF